MPRPKKVLPEYKYHVSGQARVYIEGRYYYLGEHDSPESKAKYRRLVGEYITTGKPPVEEIHQGDTPITVADVTAEARHWIDTKYANSPTHQSRFSNLCTTLEDEYGDTPANEFGPRKLAELRDLFIASGNSRKYANKQTANVVRIFKYALSRELINPNVIVSLSALESLKCGQTSAKESEPVVPADIDDVRKTAKELSPVLRAMLRVQVGTGMRPAELCQMRPTDIDRSKEVWMYRPSKHKTAHKGKFKAVPILGDAREAIEDYLNRGADMPIFSPAESMEWYRVQRAAARVTPDGPGRNKRGTNRVAVRQVEPGQCYTSASYYRAICRAAKKAGVPHWTPYQLRHLCATTIRDVLGLEHAQAALGHSNANMTQHYAKQSEAKAIEAARVAPKL